PPPRRPARPRPGAPGRPVGPTPTNDRGLPLPGRRPAGLRPGVEPQADEERRRGGRLARRVRPPPVLLRPRPRRLGAGAEGHPRPALPDPRPPGAPPPARPPPAGLPGGYPARPRRLGRPPRLGRPRLADAGALPGPRFLRRPA